jgi:hypothetical protein
MGDFKEKAVFIWEQSTIYGGNVGQIVGAVKAAGFEAVYIHVSDINTWSGGGRPALAQALQQAGVLVYGSAAVYGADPAGEGTKAAAIVQTYGLAGFVFDAESTFDAKPNAAANAGIVLGQYHAGSGGKPSAWCWWARYKSPANGAAWHPVAVLQAAMQKATVGMPMAYWSGEGVEAAVILLQQTFQQWRQVTLKPIVPIGRAYTGDGGVVTAGSVVAFEQAARQLGAVGVAWWSMRHAVVLPDIWSALASLPGFGSGGDQVPPVGYATVEQLQQLRDELQAQLSAMQQSLGLLSGRVSVLEGKMALLEQFRDNVKGA